MGIVYLQRCDLDGSSSVYVHKDDDGNIWIATDGNGAVMLEPESARKLAAELIRLADEVA